MWDVEGTNDFREWYDSLDERTQDRVTIIVDLLEEQGPALPRPYADTLTGTQLPNLKELRPTSTVRILFAFDPERTAILLLGGDKSGNKNWYSESIPRAEALYAGYLNEKGLRHGFDKMEGDQQGGP